MQNATGLTGSASALRRDWHAFGVSVYRTQDDIVHSDFIYLIEPAGHLRELLHPDVRLADLASDPQSMATDGVGRPAEASVH